MSRFSQTFERLAATIEARKGADPASSYTAKLLSEGVERAAKKFGEEAVEAVIAAVSEDDPALIGEASDLVFHLSILIADRGLTWDMIAAELDRRHGTSGHAEKASRAR